VGGGLEALAGVLGVAGLVPHEHLLCFNCGVGVVGDGRGGGAKEVKAQLPHSQLLWRLRALCVGAFEEQFVRALTHLLVAVCEARHVAVVGSAWIGKQ